MERNIVKIGEKYYVEKGIKDSSGNTLYLKQDLSRQDVLIFCEEEQKRLDELLTSLQLRSVSIKKYKRKLETEYHSIKNGQ